MAWTRLRLEGLLKQVCFWQILLQKSVEED